MWARGWNRVTDDHFARLKEDGLFLVAPGFQGNNPGAGGDATYLPDGHVLAVTDLSPQAEPLLRLAACVAWDSGSAPDRPTGRFVGASDAK